MSLLEAVVLGFVQGLTEFLPVSSSAHLIIVPELFGWPTPSLAFGVMLHIGTLAAVVFYFRKELVAILLLLNKPGPERRLTWFLILGTIPAVISGAFLEREVSDLFESPRRSSMFLIGTALILVAAESYARLKKGHTDNGGSGELDDLASQLSWGKSLMIGVGQALAIFPGLSRSGLTISTALATGLTRPQAARFSFLLSIPVLFGAVIFELPQMTEMEVGIGPILAGVLASLIFGYIAVAGLIGYLQRHGLYAFAAYCLILGGLGVSFLTS